MTRIQLAWLNTGGSNEDYWYVLAFRLALKVTLTVRRLIPKKQKWQWTVGYRSTWLNILFPFPESFSTLVSFLSPLSGTPPASDGGVAFLCSHLHMSTGISSGAVGKRLPASGGSFGGRPLRGGFPGNPLSRDSPGSIQGSGLAQEGTPGRGGRQDRGLPDNPEDTQNLRRKQGCGAK